MKISIFKTTADQEKIQMLELLRIKPLLLSHPLDVAEILLEKTNLEPIISNAVEALRFRIETK